MQTLQLLNLILILTFSSLTLTAQIKPIRDLKPTVILISLDGFRYDYLDKYKPEFLNRLAKNGIRAKWMIPSFPTKTFPNHYTVATGLYPAHHGIIENNIYDPDFDAVFGLHKREEVQNPRWWSGEPIWVTAQKQGQNAGAFFFPGTETEIKGVRPTFWKEYDGSIPNEQRVDQILRWIELPVSQRPTFYTLYFSDTDDAGHKFSPDAPEVQEAVDKVDGDLKRLYDGLKKMKIEKKVNLIIMSDHGMATVLPENNVILDEFFDLDLADRILWTGEIVQIFPKKDKEDEIISALKNLKHAVCWRKNDIPDRLHYQDNPRIAPIVCSSKEGYKMTSKERLETSRQQTDWNNKRGAHGYDNKYQSMQATFIAHGAAFKKGYVAEPFENIQVYNLMCNILGLTPAPNDGNHELGKRILKSPIKFIEPKEFN